MSLLLPLLLGLALDEAAPAPHPDEVLVTARRRAEPVRQVPLSVGVLTGEELARRAPVDLLDALRAEPGVSFRDRGAGRQSIILRGVTTGRDSVPLSQVYFGDVPLDTTLDNVKTGEPTLQPVDLARIEILKGPQGTLYGTSSMGGAVKLVPAAPDPSRNFVVIEGDLRVPSRSDVGGRGSVTFNQSLAEGVALRTVFYAGDQPGLYRNRYPGLTGNGRVGGVDHLGGRATLRWERDNDLSLQVTMAAQRTRERGVAEGDLPGSAAIPGPLGPFDQYRATPERLRDKTLLLVSDLRVGGPRLNLAWVSGAQVRTVDAGVDFSALTRFGLLLPDQERNRTRQLSEELRGEFRPNDRVRVTAGAFWSLQRQRFRQLVAIAPLPPGSGLDFDRFFRQRQLGLFIDGELTLLPGVKAEAGVRWTDYRQRYDLTASGAFNGGAQTDGGRRTTRAVTPRFALSYEPAERALAYVSASRGVRAGIFSTQVPAATCGTYPPGSNPDNVWSYELGGKIERRGLFATAAAYHTDWNGIQTVLPLACGFAVPRNFGRAAIDGAEAQAELRRARWTLGLGAAWTDARLTQANPGLGARDGDRLPNVPRWSVRARAEWRPIATRRDLWVRADLARVSDYYDDFARSRAYRAGDFTLVDLSAGLTLGPADLSVQARNLLNETAVTSVDSLLGTAQRRLAEPRTVVLRARISL